MNMPGPRERFVEFQPPGRMTRIASARRSAVLAQRLQVSRGMLESCCGTGVAGVDVQAGVEHAVAVRPAWRRPDARPRSRIRACRGPWGRLASFAWGHEPRGIRPAPR